MATIKQIKQILDEGNSIKLVAQAYSEIAALKLQKIRTGIEQNRHFFEEIIAVFRSVKAIASNKGIAATTKTKGTISVLITSNSRFYGDIDSQLIKFYIENTARLNTDRIIIGKTALDYFHGTNYQYPYESVALKSDLPTYDELHSFSPFLKEYRQILVYFPRYSSILSQQPQAVDITQSQAPQLTPLNQESFDFIFEPDIEKTLQFFETHIVTLLLEQTFLEAELARTAARIVAMNKAEANAKNFIEKMQNELSSAQRTLNNFSLLETVASYSEWRQHHG